MKVMDAVSLVANVGAGVDVFSTEREKGHGIVRSAAGAVADFAFYEMLGPYAMGLFAVQMAGAGAGALHQMGYDNARISREAHKSNLGGNFRDTQQAATMRMRGLQAMQQSQLQGYSTLGNEARRYIK